MQGEGGLRMGGRRCGRVHVYAKVQGQYILGLDFSEVSKAETASLLYSLYMRQAAEWDCENVSEEIYIDGLICTHRPTHT